MACPHIAWAAGIFEGEGYISDGKHNYRLAINMTDYDVLRKFCDVVGYGNVRELHGKKIDEYVAIGRYKQPYTWEINKKSETKRILELFLPYLGSRRAHRALNLIDKVDGIKNVQNPLSN